jgi:DNA-binding phage protein
MKLKDYREDLLKRLVDPTYSAEYLAETLASGDDGAFLIALKDVVDAGGGVTWVPEPSTYALGILGMGALALFRRRT